MPELPEVETVLRSLQPLVQGQCLKKIQINWPRISATALPELESQEILSCQRRAKFLLWKLEKGTLAFHLRMTGKLIPSSHAQARQKHVHAVLHFQNGLQIYFEDVRKFGRLYFFASDEFENWQSQWGMEPLDPAFSGSSLERAAAGKSGALKPKLLDQRFIAGLGNIYVDEVLWAAKLHPLRNVNTLAEQEWQRLARTIQSVLRRAIKANGTTFLDFKFLGGEEGGYNSQLKAFQKTGRPCQRCRTLIARMQVAQRSTHFCPACQTLPGAYS